MLRNSCMSTLLPSSKSLTGLMLRQRGGTRDAELTNHGYQQAFYLGKYLRAQGIIIKHTHSSTLSRAVRTAEQILHGQGQNIVERDTALHLTPLLMEQDFGSLEGTSWVRKASSKYYGRGSSGPRERSSNANKTTSGSSYIPRESERSLEQRANKFVNQCLIPSLEDASKSEEAVAMMVVSHGVMLKYISRQFTSQLPAGSLYHGSWKDCNVLCPQSLDIRQWSNTGYLELHFSPVKTLQHHNLFAPVLDYRKGMEDVTKDRTSSLAEAVKLRSDKDKLDDGQRIQFGAASNMEERNMHLKAVPKRTKNFPDSWITLIVTVNGTMHLRSLKRTGGGIGSAKHDKHQKTLHDLLTH